MFRFRPKEICPLFEEFSTTLHTDLHVELVFPSVQGGYVQDLASLPHPSTTTASSFIRDRQIDFSQLFAFYAPVGDLDGDY